MREHSPIILLSEDPLFEIFNNSNESCPEKLLMVSMLARAFMDLSTVTDGVKHRTSAIKWFLSEETQYIFSYRHIRSHLPLSRKLLDHINSALNRAIEADKENRHAAKQSEGKESGEEPGELDESTGNPFGQKIAAVLWA